MVRSQDAIDEADQCDTDHCEAKKVAESLPASTKVVNAQVLAGGYTEGLCSIA